MGPKLYHLFIWMVLLVKQVTASFLIGNFTQWPHSKPQNFAQTVEFGPTLDDEDHWMFRNSKASTDLSHQSCFKVQPSARNIIKRFYAILPYLDKDHGNAAFLHKLRATVHSMAQGGDKLDQEAAYYATVVTPLVYLQNYRDAWCLLERFHRALRLYQTSHPTEKRSSLKLLQNLRSINKKVQSFIENLPGPVKPSTKASAIMDFDDEELHDKKDIRYLKELIKNLG